MIRNFRFLNGSFASFGVNVGLCKSVPFMTRKPLSLVRSDRSPNCLFKSGSGGRIATRNCMTSKLYQTALMVWTTLPQALLIFKITILVV